jgi:hypothetical protein
MYIDRWDNHNLSFERNRFLNLVNQLNNQLVEASLNLEHFHSSDMIQRIDELISLGYAGTDEPPLKHVVKEANTLSIIRPFFDIFEHELLKLTKVLDIVPVPDGCELTIKTLNTPREMIHQTLFTQTHIQGMFEKALHQMVVQSLTPDGKQLKDIRNQRHILLGETYKPSPLNLKF